MTMLHRLALPVLAIGTLAACDPQAMADKTMRRVAYDVVFPVVNRDMPAGPAASATNCILDAATMPEIRMLARDTGVEAGTQTKENIRNLATRPGTQACFAAAGVPPVK